MAHPGGRPTDYCPEIVEKICHAIISNSMGLPRLCKKFDELPGLTTIKTWISKYPEFRAKYLQAKRLQADFLFDEILDIADEDEEDNLIKINRAKLKMDARKHKAAILKPDDYGEKTSKTHDVTIRQDDVLNKAKENIDSYEKK